MKGEARMLGKWSSASKNKRLGQKKTYVHQMQTMKTKLFLYFLICNLFLACQEANKEVTESWENGKEKKVRINEKTFSYESNYFENGKVESEGIIKEERKEKAWIYFYPNGKVKQEIYYREGKPFEKAKYYYENGNINIEAEYDDVGLKSGYWETYSNIGKLLSKGNYAQGRKVENWHYYNTEGSLEKEEKLDNFGRYEYVNIYNNKGDLVRYSEYYKSNGIKLEFYQLDSSSNKVFYRSFYENGNIELEGIKLNTHEIGLWTYWHGNGVKKAQGNFIEDIDKFKYRDIVQINQKISSMLPLQSVIKGIKVGKWEYWNKEGKKVAEIESKVKADKIVDKLIYINKKLLE